MTDNLLYTLEEKIMTLLSELDGLRKHLSMLEHENSLLKNAQSEHTKKLQGLISVLDSLNEKTNTTSVDHIGKREEEYATA